MVQSLAIAQMAGVSPTRVFDVRALHARVLWDNGWGRGRFPHFAAYLATIPPVPRHPADPRFNNLVLVDTSLPLTQACRMLGVAFGGTDSLFAVGGDMPMHEEVYWMWMQDGGDYQGYAPYDCRHAFDRNEAGLTAFEGIAFYALYARVLEDHAIDLVGSRVGSFPAYVACLQLAQGQPTLGVSEYVVGSAQRGTASKWR